MYEELVIRCRDNGMILCGHMQTDFWDAADAIEKLQKLTDAQLDIIKQYQVYLIKHRWIPVTERLPEPFTRVIGFMAWKAITAVEYQHNNWYSIDHLEPLPREAITHWMPLPEPPKEET